MKEAEALREWILCQPSDERRDKALALLDALTATYEAREREQQGMLNEALNRAALGETLAKKWEENARTTLAALRSEREMTREITRERDALAGARDHALLMLRERDREVIAMRGDIRRVVEAANEGGQRHNAQRAAV